MTIHEHYLREKSVCVPESTAHREETDNTA